MHAVVWAGACARVSAFLPVRLRRSAFVPCCACQTVGSGVDRQYIGVHLVAWSGISACQVPQSHVKVKTHIQTHIYTLTHIRTRTYAHAHAHAHTNTNTNTQTHKHTNTQTHKHTNTQTHKHARTHARTHKGYTTRDGGQTSDPTLNQFSSSTFSVRFSNYLCLSTSRLHNVSIYVFINAICCQAPTLMKQCIDLSLPLGILAARVVCRGKALTVTRSPLINRVCWLGLTETRMSAAYFGL